MEYLRSILISIVIRSDLVISCLVLEVGNMASQKIGWGVAFVEAVEKDNVRYNPKHKPCKPVKLVKTKKWNLAKDSLAV